MASLIQSQSLKISSISTISTTSSQQQATKTEIDEKDWVQKQDYFYISQRYIPRIFQFNYKVLSKLRIKQQSSQYVKKLFQFIISKIILNKYSKNKSNKNEALRNRMKTQQKIKFLMRSFQIKYAQLYDPQFKVNTTKFNKEAQKDFFEKAQVKKYFLAFLPQIIKQKRQYNKCRMQEAENILTGQILMSKVKQNHEISGSIRRMQLPWTENMFSDIERFGQQWHSFFVEGSDKQLQSQVTNQEQ